MCPTDTKGIKTEHKCEGCGHIYKDKVYGVSLALLQVGFPLEVQKLLQNYRMQALHRKHDLYFLHQYLDHPTQPNTGEPEKIEVLALFLNLPKSCYKIYRELKQQTQKLTGSICKQSRWQFYSINPKIWEDMGGSQQQLWDLQSESVHEKVKKAKKCLIFFFY